MAMTLDGSGGLFNYIGTFHRAMINVFEVDNLTPELRALAYRNIRPVAEGYLTEFVNLDSPVGNDVGSALTEVVRQAIEQSESCDQPTATSTTLTDGSTSNSLRRAASYVGRFNLPHYSHFTHTVTYECISAPQIGFNHTAVWRSSANRRQDFSTWGSTGDAFTGLLYNGTRFNLASGQVDGTTHIQNQNILTNSGFERFGGTTANTPDNWTASTWVAGTHFNAVTTPYIGTNALRLIGDGSTNGKLRQVLNDSTGSLVQLQPRTHYYIGAMVRRYATGAVTGVIRLSIENSGGTEQYSSGVALDVSTATTTYTELGVVFYTGDIPSATNYVVIESTTAIGNTHEVFIDELIVAPMLVIPGHGRQFFGEGSASCEVGDRYTVLRTNDLTGFQLVAWERLFDLSARYDLCMPVENTGSETIVDVITANTP